MERCLYCGEEIEDPAERWPAGIGGHVVCQYHWENPPDDWIGKRMAALLEEMDILNKAAAAAANLAATLSIAPEGNLYYNDAYADELLELLEAASQFLPKQGE